jgi:DnaJ-class molecular chaperone
MGFLGLKEKSPDELRKCHLQTDICPKCHGDGEYWDSEDETIDECSMCKGTGKRSVV